MKLQEWKSKYEAAKGTPEHFKDVAEYQSKINGRWKFVGHGVPNPERQYDIKKHGGKMYLVSANGTKDSLSIMQNCWTTELVLRGGIIFLKNVQYLSGLNPDFNSF